MDSQPNIVKVLVCQNRTCKKDGAAKVLEAFQASGVEVVKCGCLGMCGSGPIAIVRDSQDWFYWRLKPKKVKLIVAQHLQNDEPIQEFLHPKVHKVT
jgi:(2Fe-2S) ferredoxin